ncbi:MAG: tRNA (adenosine(37)-N6)-threonylcarbamoyltransferase complex dimerization subunit type 1 TsaB [Pseudomonadota bacterium]
MLLAIDTSGADCAACLLSADGTLVAKISETLWRGHAERLMPMLEALLLKAHCGWNDLTHIACTIGPGSFTGLRVGLATARGLALATGLPKTGVGVLEAMAQPVAGPVAVAMDAKRGEVWFAAFGPSSTSDHDPSRAELFPPTALPVQDAADRVIENGWPVTGSGVGLLQSVSNKIGLAKPDSAADVLDNGPDVEPDVEPDIEIVAHLARARFARDATLPLSALYLRAPDAKPQATLVHAASDVLSTPASSEGGQ